MTFAPPYQDPESHLQNLLSAQLPAVETHRQSRTQYASREPRISPEAAHDMKRASSLFLQGLVPSAERHTISVPAGMARALRALVDGSLGRRGRG